MKVYLVKHVGASISRNFLSTSTEIQIGKKRMHFSKAFLRRKDAVEYKKNLIFSEYHEVIPAEVGPSSGDNRRRK